MPSPPSSNKNVEALFQQALRYHQAGNLEAAQPLYMRVLTANPHHANALANLSTLYSQRGDIESCAHWIERSIAVNPHQAGAYFNYGNALTILKRYDEALAAYDKALTLQPRSAIFHSNRGITLYFLKRYDEALAAYEQALRLEPNLAMAFINRGNTRKRIGLIEEALADYEHAIHLTPDDGSIYNNRADLLNRFRRYDEALAATEQAIAVGTITALTYNTRGLALAGLWRFEEALASYARAAELDPDFASAPWNASLIHLTFGRFEEGYRLYEWRWKTELQKDTLRTFTQPLWLGETPLAGKAILIYIEQGLGDFIQYSRYFPLLEAMGAHVLVETPLPLIDLLRESLATPRITFLAGGDFLPAFDLQCPLMSLPLAFQTTLATIPNSVPYLQINAGKKRRWQEMLGSKSSPRIGLVWSGGATHTNDHNRSIPLALLAPLLALPYEFHALQKEVRDSDAASLGPIHMHATELHDFTDTAALLAHMDLVITVDTSTAHLAGALGKPVWILLAHTPDFRWMLERTDSLWYPSARLFRQSAIGDWPNAIAQVIQALTTLFPCE